MEYRTFGKTGLDLSVITLGGMRYLHGWDAPRDLVPDDTLEQATRITKAALDSGINHIETAHGYGKSEHAYGRVLNQELKIPRSSYRLMTKGAPKTADETRRLVDEQLKALRTDRIDLYGWHGLNNTELLAQATAKRGPVEELLKLRDEGIIGHVGFSTHGPVEVIIDAIATGLFSFVNLHYYYFFQRNGAAVTYASTKGLGVFIISPNDKGGQLFNPSAQLKSDCAPLTPIQFNARWCLRSPHVHTLSFGLTENSHLAEMQGIFPAQVPADPQVQAIAHTLAGRELADPVSAWEGWEYANDPSGLNIPEILRFRRLWKCHGMRDFGIYRYNMLESKGHWFPGNFATPDRVALVDPTKAPAGIDVRALLTETHNEFYRPKAAKA